MLQIVDTNVETANGQGQLTEYEETEESQADTEDQADQAATNKEASVAVTVYLKCGTNQEIRVSETKEDPLEREAQSEDIASQFM